MKNKLWESKDSILSDQDSITFNIVLGRIVKFLCFLFWFVSSNTVDKVSISILMRLNASKGKVCCLGGNKNKVFFLFEDIVEVEDFLKR